jgi:hypothetical protein
MVSVSSSLKKTGCMQKKQYSDKKRVRHHHHSLIHQSKSSLAEHTLAARP